MPRRMIVFVAAFALAFAIAGCSSGGSSASPSSPSESPSSSTAAPAAFQSEKWPSNAAGKLVPTPTFTQDIEIVSEGDELLARAIYYNISIEEAQEYIEEVKRAGFTENPSTLSSSENINYQAKNANGDSVHIRFQTGNDPETMCTIQVFKRG